MLTASGGSVAETTALCDDWVFVCAEPGAVISISLTGKRLARVVIFLDSGETLWFDSEPEQGRQGFEHVRPVAPGRAEFWASIDARQADGTAEVEVGNFSPSAARVPVILDVALSPLAPTALLEDASGSGAPVPAQAFRAVGTLAVGSVIRPLLGQAWFSRSGFTGRQVGPGSRVHAAFQDQSSLYAARTGLTPTEGRFAALQVHNRIARLKVPRIGVAGPERTVPSSVRVEVGSGVARAVTGMPRHVEGYQHVAFMRPASAAGEWVREGYTPFDFVRSGTTGFGLLEHVTRVVGRLGPAPEAELPDPWD